MGLLQQRQHHTCLLPNPRVARPNHGHGSFLSHNPDSFLTLLSQCSPAPIQVQSIATLQLQRHPRIRQLLPLRVPKFRQPQAQFHVHLPDDHRGLASVSLAHPSLPTSLAGYEVLHIFYQTTQWPSGLLIINS